MRYATFHQASATDWTRACTPYLRHLRSTKYCISLQRVDDATDTGPSSRYADRVLSVPNIAQGSRSNVDSQSDTREVNGPGPMPVCETTCHSSGTDRLGRAKEARTNYAVTTSYSVLVTTQYFVRRTLYVFGDSRCLPSDLNGLFGLIEGRRHNIRSLYRVDAGSVKMARQTHLSPLGLLYESRYIH